VADQRRYATLFAKGEDRRQRILAVAQRLMTRNGGRGTTLSQIAQEAGVTTAGLLHHFESKEQLLHAVLDARDADDMAHVDMSGDVVTPPSAPIAAMASSNRRRCPTKVTPRSFKSSAVRIGRTLASIALSRNAGAYCSSPSLRNHSVISVEIAGMATSPPYLEPSTYVDKEYHAPTGRSAIHFAIV